MKDQVIENMSEVCHEEWMGWSKDISKELYVVVDVLKKDIEYFRENGVENKNAIDLVQKLESRLERWESLWIPYDELTEEMKDADAEMLQDMLITGINSALEQSKKLQEDQMSSITGGLTSGLAGLGLGF